jgi:CHAD domain-containing protein
VASRRLREILPVLGLEAPTCQNLCHRLKKVTRRLGAVREEDVLIALISELGQPRYSPAALTEIAEPVGRARAEAQLRLVDRLPPGKMNGLADRLELAADQLQLDDERSQRRRQHRQAWLWALDARAARRAGQARSVIDAVGGVYVPGRLHGVRIAVKKFRYSLELVAEARNRRTTADIGALKAAQDILGRLHDVEVLIERARHVQASVSPPKLAAWREVGSLVHALEDDCRELDARYRQLSPKLITIADRVAGAQRLSSRTRRSAG